MTTIPSEDLALCEPELYLPRALSTKRRRTAKVLHSPGDFNNRVFNYLANDTYMQPHCHPSEEKIEFIHLVQGKIAVLYFSKDGNLQQIISLEEPLHDFIKVPAHQFHTYVLLTETAVTYETMHGIYKPDTWKKFSDWAPSEDESGSSAYLASLKELALNNFNQVDH